MRSVSLVRLLCP
jgi:serine/threonine-protein phosphatase 5